MNCDELEVKELARALFELEGALLSRMATRFSEDGRSLIPLAQRIGVPADTDELARFLERAHAAHRNVSDPEAYRPTSIDADAIAFKLAKACMNNGLTQWQSLANALATALEVDNAVNWKAAHPTLALIQRIKLEAEAREQFGAGILTTVYSAYQLLTVFHHAHVFGRFPVLTLQYISMDLRAALLRQARMLEGLQLTILEKKAN